jgi:hypothetical protein
VYQEQGRRLQGAGAVDEPEDGSREKGVTVREKRNTIREKRVPIREKGITETT